MSATVPRSATLCKATSRQATLQCANGSNAAQQHENRTGCQKRCSTSSNAVTCQRSSNTAALQRGSSVPPLQVRHGGCGCSATGAAQQQHCSVTAAVQHDSSGAARQQQCRGPAPERCSNFESPAALLWTLRVCVHMVRSAAAAALALCHTLLAQHGAGCCADTTPSSACVCPCKWRGFTAACCRLRSAVLTGSARQEIEAHASRTGVHAAACHSKEHVSPC